MVAALEHAGKASASASAALPAGTRVGEFEVLAVLGVGGFGIVYRAFDHSLQREVALKEYMPSALAGRTSSQQVNLHARGYADNFSLGLRSFVNEARLLARFDHPSLLKVHRFWEANGTAYMAMPLYRGRTLKEARLNLGRAPTEAEVRAVLLPLLGALTRLHAEGVTHRDISPDNILIEEDGRPVLLDFGAARQVLGTSDRTITAILKPAYAPIEQYGEAQSVRQGPWTDLYSLGATMHFMLMGMAPPPATARAVHDDLAPLVHACLPGCSEAFLACLDWMLAPAPAARPQTVEEVLKRLQAMPRSTAPVPLLEQAREPKDDGDGRWAHTEMMPGALTVAQADGDPDDEAQAAELEHLQANATTMPMRRPRRRRKEVEDARPATPKATLKPGAKAATGTRAGWVAMALAAVLGLVVLGAALRSKAPEPQATAELSATQPAALRPASAAAPSQAQPALPAAAAASSPAVPAAAQPPGPSLAPSAVPAPRPKPAQAASRPASASGAGAGPAQSTAKPALATPTPARTATPTSATAAELQPAKAAAAPSTPSEPARSASPSERCSDRVFLGHFICVEQECRKPELRSHAQCVELRRQQELRARGEQP